MQIFCSHDFKILTFRCLLVKSVRIANIHEADRFFRKQNVLRQSTNSNIIQNQKFRLPLSCNRYIKSVISHAIYLTYTLNTIILSARRNSKVRPTELHNQCPFPLYRPPLPYILLSLNFSSPCYSERSENHETFPRRQRDTNPASDSGLIYKYFGALLLKQSAWHCFV